MADILSKDEKERVKMCISNILDKTSAIMSEIEEDRSYKYYIKDKIDSVLWDSKVIQSLCAKEEDVDE